MMSVEQRRPLMALCLLGCFAAMIIANGVRTDFVEVLVEVEAPAPVISALAPDMVLGHSLDGRPLPVHAASGPRGDVQDVGTGAAEPVALPAEVPTVLPIAPRAVTPAPVAGAASGTRPATAPRHARKAPAKRKHTAATSPGRGHAAKVPPGRAGAGKGPARANPGHSTATRPRHTAPVRTVTPPRRSTPGPPAHAVAKGQHKPGKAHAKRAHGKAHAKAHRKAHAKAHGKAHGHKKGHGSRGKGRR